VRKEEVNQTKEIKVSKPRNPESQSVSSSNRYHAAQYHPSSFLGSLAECALISRNKGKHHSFDSLLHVL
jgi:hypothetical protein